MAKTIVGMGNPLLDISAEVGADWLTKYDLKPANAILAEEKHLPLYPELAALPHVQYIPGGATLNAIRVANWMLNAAGHPGKVAYTGCIGVDKFGDILKEKSEAEGLIMPLQRVDDTPTGTCAVLITGKERSMVANLAAANKWNQSHTDTPELKAVLDNADIVYSSGFFLTVSVDTMLAVAKKTEERGGTYCLNLAAPFIMQYFGEQLKQVLFYTDIIFGNESEAKQFGDSNGYGTDDVVAIAKKLQAEAKSSSKPRIVVITQGRDPTVVATATGVQEIPVELLDAKLIVDTNAAGDAFVGGFLALFATGAPLEKCVNAGNYSAREIIQQSGCSFPAHGAQYQF